jgi:hypothetical protein
MFDVSALFESTDSQVLPENQGQTKVEDLPGPYRLKLSPGDPNQEYVVTAYENVTIRGSTDHAKVQSFSECFPKP